jgi:hypothetical protein
MAWSGGCAAHLLKKDYFGVNVVGHEVSVSVYLWSVDFYGTGTYCRGHADLNGRVT